MFADRVRCAEWVRKLISLSEDNLETAKIRNEYAQLLRIQVRNRLIHGPFASPPPDSHIGLCSLPEALGAMIGQQVCIAYSYNQLYTSRLQFRINTSKSI